MPRVGAVVGSDGQRASGPCARATASSTTSSRTAPAPRRRWRSARRRGRSSISSAAPVSTFRIPTRDGPLPAPNTFVRPSTVFALDADAKPPSVQNWNVSVQRSLFEKYLVEVRYVGAAGRNLPRNVEANPAVFGPGATAQNADRRRLYANCPADGGTCDFSTVAMLQEHHQVELSGGPGQHLAPLRRRHRLQRVVLVFENRTTICRR